MMSIDIGPTELVLLILSPRTERSLTDHLCRLFGGSLRGSFVSIVLCGACTPAVALEL